MILRLIGKFLLWLYGWKYDIRPIYGVDKCVLIVAPHTSLWDMIFGKAVFDQEYVPVKFAIKKEAFYFPMGMILRSVGGIPIDRTPNKGTRISLVDAMANTIRQEKEICMVITPEGSRSVRKQWRTGFYYVALKAQVPIALGCLDFKHKEARIHKLIQPSGDIDKDMRLIMDFYRDKINLGKHPGHSFLDERWA